MNRINKVLLVDDDNVTNYLNILILTRMSLTRKMEIRIHGGEALEDLIECDAQGNEYPELIFLDLNMPCIDGIQFLEEYGKLKSPKKDKTKIVLLSAVKNERTMNICHQFGIEDFIEKPLSTEKIKGILKSKALV